jgi:predicted dithiol-disulfide oxidoreductase (DUF899 family)
VNIHLKQRDVTMVAVSRAPYAKLAAYQRRMGWTFPWYSSGDTDFNFDYNVSFTPEAMAAGTTVFNFKKQPPGNAEREGHSAHVSNDFFPETFVVVSQRNKTCVRSALARQL